MRYGTWGLIFVIAAGLGATPLWGQDKEKAGKKQDGGHAKAGRRGENYKLFLDEVYRAEPALESLLNLKPEQTVRLQEALKDTWHSPRLEELYQKMRAADSRERRQLQERYDRAADHARSTYESRWRQILYQDQASFVSRINSAVEHLVEKPANRRAPKKSPVKILAEINERLDSVLTDAQKRQLGRGQRAGKK